MKIKQHLYVSDRNAFLKGDYGQCFTVMAGDWMKGEWTYCGVIELNIDVDTGEVVNALSRDIDFQIADLTARTVVLETRKKELLALTHETAA